MEKKTPLYDAHVALGGKIVPFAGFLMPVQYPAGVIQEHMAVRTRAGLFDVSHMGEVFYEGPDALRNLNNLLTNDFAGMNDGQVRYSPMCNERGGIVDDLIVYRFHENKYMVVINAGNIDKDVAWMKAHLEGDVTFTDRSSELCELAIQGPAAKAILSKLADHDALPKKYYYFTDRVDVGGIDCLISRTGYTGEHGYELYADAGQAVNLWNQLLDAGKEEGLIPCGLGARDTLRLEAGMPLYGHEMSDEISPLEAGLGWAVKMGKPGFVGKGAIQAIGTPRARIALKVTGKGIVREQQDVFLGGEKIGVTTSGTHLPFLGGAYAMALVDSEHTEIGTRVEVDVRGRRVEAEIVTQPFYKRA